MALKTVGRCKNNDKSSSSAGAHGVFLFSLTPAIVLNMCTSVHVLLCEPVLGTKYELNVCHKNLRGSSNRNSRYSTVPSIKPIALLLTQAN